MNATQKTAILNLAVAAGTMVIVAVLLPWMGDDSAGAFGLLGAVGLSPWLFRSRDGGVAVDERDAAIDRTAALISFAVAWVVSLLALAGLAAWHGESGVPARTVWWLLWIDFAVLYGVRGGVALACYRGGPHAA